MKRFVKTIFWQSLLWILPISAQAQFTFATNNGTITITGYTGPGGNVTIPSATNGYPVTCIGDFAFRICPGPTSMTIPSSITNIGRGAFCGCISATNFTVDAANPNYASAGGALFDKAMTTLIQCPGGMTGSFAISNGVTNIGNDAFLDCSGLTNVMISDSVTSISREAFHSCSGLTSMMIPNSVTNVGAEAFYFCSGLTSVSIGNGVTSISEEEFEGCSRLTSVTIPDSVVTIAGGETVGVHAS